MISNSKQVFSLLKLYWGYEALRPLQEKVIHHVLDQKDTLAILPTGGGKSLCYQLPAMVMPGICLVISPLVALMKDQVEGLKKRGIKAMAIPSGLSFEEVDTLLDNGIYGDYKFLYLSPERLQQPLVQERIRQMNVNLIAVDEAHCISQWGQDFRPAYRDCALLRELHPHVPFLAVTATATTVVEKDIVDNLKLSEVNIIRGSVHRPELAYWVVEEEDKWYRTETILKKQSGSAIVYVRTRKSVGVTSRELEARGLKTTVYHGGLSGKEKEKNLNLWVRNDVQIMVATNAFGMGIDKPDVRTVIHMALPDSVEAYYQEAGRAGRDGVKSFAILLHGSGDHIQLHNQFIEVLPDSKYLKLVYRHLNTYLQIPYGEGLEEMFQLNFNHFCHRYQLHPVKAYHALKSLERHGILLLEERFEQFTEVHIRTSPQRFIKEIQRDHRMEIAMQSMLRSYGGLFELSVRVNPDLIASRIGMETAEFTAMLDQLHKEEVLEVKGQNTDTLLQFLQPREDERTILQIARDADNYYNARITQIRKLEAYVQNNAVCRAVQLQRYFGEKALDKPCGICSVCVQQSKKQITPSQEAAELILKQLSIQPASSRELAAVLLMEEELLLTTLKRLLEEGMITLTNANKYTLHGTK